ncbi:MAG: hypothetical protein Q27BB25_00115 [Blastomonas sp. CACIA14H2]|nr:MAG: hypothetical protein Q27BB25_00115 [Blastomonas sp. CACIA14H2]
MLAPRGSGDIDGSPLLLLNHSLDCQSGALARLQQFKDIPVRVATKEDGC